MRTRTGDGDGEGFRGSIVQMSMPSLLSTISISISNLITFFFLFLLKLCFTFWELASLRSLQLQMQCAICNVDFGVRMFEFGLKDSTLNSKT